MNNGLIHFKEKPTIYVHTGYITMAYSFNGLMDAVLKTLKRKPSENELFVFFNKARTKVKILFYHGNGFVIVYKSLDNDVFELEYKAGVKRIKNINADKLLEDLNTDKLIGRA